MLWRSSVQLKKNSILRTNQLKYFGYIFSLQSFELDPNTIAVISHLKQSENLSVSICKPNLSFVYLSIPWLKCVDTPDAEVCAWWSRSQPCLNMTMRSNRHWLYPIFCLRSFIQFSNRYSFSTTVNKIQRIGIENVSQTNTFLTTYVVFVGKSIDSKIDC